MTLPKTIFVYEESDPNDRTKWLTAHKDFEDAADQNDKKKVGVYRLEKMVTLENKTTVKG